MSLKHRRLLIRSAIVVWLSVSSLAWAASKTQTVVLRPGWNAVYLEVTPEPGAIELVFEGIPVLAVWRHNADQSPVRFVDDASTLKPIPGRWLTWVPSEGDRGGVIQTLHTVHGGASYLIELGGSTEVTWTVEGRPALRDLSWLSASFSLAGLCVDPSSPVTFDQYFNLSPAHQNLDVRQIGADGRWTQIPSNTPIQRGESYWIYSAEISSFQGAGGVKVDNRGLLDYGAAFSEHSLVLCNNTASDAAYTLRLDAANAPAGESSAGPLAISYWQDGSDGSNYGWEPLSETATVVVPAGLEKTIRLAIRRSDMTGQGEGIDFHSILSVAGLMTCQEIGLRADGFTFDPGRFAGLWAGECILSEVSLAEGDTTGPTLPTASTATLRLLMRVAGDGTASLLREATVLWLDGSTVDGVVTEPGRYLVAANAAELAELERLHGPVGNGRLKGVAIRDGRNTPRRLSSVGFSFRDPVSMTGLFTPSGTQLDATVNVGYDDDLNPYKHRYHPDHDNLKAGTTGKLPEGQESYSFSRLLTFHFLAADTQDLRTAGWGDTTVGGNYEETVAGLHRYPIKVKGTFRLSQVVSLRP